MTMVAENAVIYVERSDLSAEITKSERSLYVKNTYIDVHEPSEDD